MEKIYSYLDEANCAYLLRKGTIFFEIKDGEYYKISGKNLIVAASEIVLNFDSDSEYYYRAYNLYKDENTELDEISPDNLKKLILKYNIGYNMNIYLAQMIIITNKILSKRQEMLTDDAKAVQEMSRFYYEVTNSLLELGKKTKFPDIVQLGEKCKSELIFETGKVFSQKKSTVQLEMKKEKLDEFSNAYSPNSIICEEGEEGKEMYILNKGRIGVFINENKVAEIKKVGTVIGVIALLLGERRTATLKAIDQVVLSIVKKDNLAEFHKIHENIFLRIGESLSIILYDNFEKIQNIDKQMTEGKSDTKVAGFLTRERADIHLIELKKNITELYETKEYEQLVEIIEKTETGLRKFIV